MASSPILSTHSNKRNQTTLALAGLFILLLGVIAWMELGNKAPSTHKQSDVSSITIKRESYDDIVLDKQSATWRIKEPYQLLANIQRITPLINFGSANFSGYAMDEVDLDATGLNDSRASIVIQGREFKLGNTDANGERRYVLVDDKVSFVPEWVWSLVHGGVTAFADLSVFTELSEPLFLSNDTNSDVIALNNLENWASLQADKIISWPNDAFSTDDGNSIQYRLTSSPNINASDAYATIVMQTDNTFIITTTNFAYAVSTERMRALIQQP